MNGLLDKPENHQRAAISKKDGRNEQKSKRVVQTREPLESKEM